MPRTEAGRALLEMQRTLPARTIVSVPAAIDAIEREAFDLAREAVADAQKALGSFLWLGNNLHNSGTDTFREMYQAALSDAERGYQALAAIDALMEEPK